MSTPSLPYIPFFGGDFLRVTAGWTLEERGALMMLTIAQWEHGHLPDDPARLARIAQTDSETFERVWPTVSTQFVQIGLGLVNEPLAKQRQKSVDRVTRQREGGTVGARRRWGTG